ncbi:hypothetical protein MTO96_041468 [Rhipicephalus appendiculatus]
MANIVIGVVAYVAASEDTCKIVIRGINLDLCDADLTAMIANRRNPAALGVRRIQKTPTMIVLFDGQTFPNTCCVMVFAALVPCNAGKWTSVTRVVISATRPTFAQRSEDQKKSLG